MQQNRLHHARMNRYTPAPDLEDRPRSGRFQQTMVRSLIAQARGDSDAANVAKTLWPRDGAVQDYLKRGAVTPLATTTSGVPSTTALADFLPLLGPQSASGGLFARALKLTLGT